MYSQAIAALEFAGAAAVKSMLQTKATESEQMNSMLQKLGCMLLALGAQQAVGAMEARFVYVGTAADTALLGVRQGLVEANLQGKFLGQQYLLEVRTPESATADLAGAVAVLAATDAATLVLLAGAAGTVPVFNLRDHDDALRADCMPNLLHIIPSAAMDRDARAQWHEAHPDAQVAASAWHSDFMKYAARDLNKRFRATTGQPMDDYAWAGWAAVKMTSDTVARLGTTQPGIVLEYLRSELRFDGQKGAEMTFRETGQLRQPLLIIEGGRIAGEAPVRGVAGPDELDTLGNTDCSK